MDAGEGAGAGERPLWRRVAQWAGIPLALLALATAATWWWILDDSDLVAVRAEARAQGVPLTMAELALPATPAADRLAMQRLEAAAKRLDVASGSLSYLVNALTAAKFAAAVAADPTLIVELRTAVETLPGVLVPEHDGRGPDRIDRHVITNALCHDVGTCAAEHLEAAIGRMRRFHQAGTTHDLSGYAIQAVGFRIHDAAGRPGIASELRAIADHAMEQQSLSARRITVELSEALEDAPKAPRRLDRLGLLQPQVEQAFPPLLMSRTRAGRATVMRQWLWYQRLLDTSPEPREWASLLRESAVQSTRDSRWAASALDQLDVYRIMSPRARLHRWLRLQMLASAIAGDTLPHDCFAADDRRVATVVELGRTIAVYSVGFNGLDEHGAGDDIKVELRPKAR